jgi:CheY-like chemotaxis protein
MNNDQTVKTGGLKKALVVDDTLIGLEAARNCLSACGIQVDCVRSGWEAIALILKDTGQYDIIFMDYICPVSFKMRAMASQPLRTQST